VHDDDAGTSAVHEPSAARTNQTRGARLIVADSAVDDRQCARIRPTVRYASAITANIAITCSRPSLIVCDGTIVQRQRAQVRNSAAQAAGETTAAGGAGLVIADNKAVEIQR